MKLNATGQLVIEPDDLPLLVRWHQKSLTDYLAILRKGEGKLRAEGEPEQADVLADAYRRLALEPVS